MHLDVCERPARRFSWQKHGRRLGGPEEGCPTPLISPGTHAPSYPPTLPGRCTALPAQRCVSGRLHCPLPPSQSRRSVFDGTSEHIEESAVDSSFEPHSHASAAFAMALSRADCERLLYRRHADRTVQACPACLQCSRLWVRAGPAAAASTARRSLGRRSSRRPAAFLARWHRTACSCAVCI